MIRNLGVFSLVAASVAGLGIATGCSSDSGTPEPADSGSDATVGGDASPLADGAADGTTGSDGNTGNAPSDAGLDTGNDAATACAPDAATPLTNFDDKDIVTITGTRARVGWNAAETALTPANAGGLQLKWESAAFAAGTAPTADGGMMTQSGKALGSPLLAEGVQIPGVGTVSVMLATTGAGWIYAVNASPMAGTVPAPGSILWSKQLTSPTAVDPDQLMGVLSTPVVDLQSNPPRVYVVSADVTSGWQVFALSLIDGTIITGWPLTINDAALGPVAVNGPSTVSWKATSHATQRGALNLSKDRKYLYAGFAGLHDASPGWLVVVDTAAGAVPTAFAEPSTVLIANAGIWAHTGITVDDDGKVFANTGNSPLNPPDAGPTPGVWGESLLAFAPGVPLTLKGTYTPWNYCSMDSPMDADLGVGSPLLIPPLDPATTSTPRLAVFGSKQGNMYLVDRDNLPGRLDQRQACSTDPTTDKSLLPPNPQPQFGTTGPLNVFGPYTEAPVKLKSRYRSSAAYFRGPCGDNYVYVTGNTKLVATLPTDGGVDNSNVDVPPSVVRLKIVTTPGKPAYLAVDATEKTLAMVNPSTPVITSNGSSDPIVWVMDTFLNDADSNDAGASAKNNPRNVLHAIDATTMQPLWQTGQGELGIGANFTIPVVKHGVVYIATDRVRAYGLP
jgi:hypothetical protein